MNEPRGVNIKQTFAFDDGALGLLAHCESKSGVMWGLLTLNRNTVVREGKDSNRKC